MTCNSWSPPSALFLPNLNTNVISHISEMEVIREHDIFMVLRKHSSSFTFLCVFCFTAKRDAQNHVRFLSSVHLLKTACITNHRLLYKMQYIYILYSSLCNQQYETATFAESPLMKKSYILVLSELKTIVQSIILRLGPIVVCQRIFIECVSSCLVALFSSQTSTFFWYFSNTFIHILFMDISTTWPLGYRLMTDEHCFFCDFVTF